MSARKAGPILIAQKRITWDVASTGTLAQTTTTTNMSGVLIGDAVNVTMDAPNSAFVYDGYVSAAGTVTLRAKNVSAGTVDPASGTGTVTVTRGVR